LGKISFKCTVPWKLLRDLAMKQLGVFYTIIVHSIGMDFINPINYPPS